MCFSHIFEYFDHSNNYLGMSGTDLDLFCMFISRCIGLLQGLAGNFVDNTRIVLVLDYRQIQTGIVNKLLILDYRMDDLLGNPLVQICKF